MYVELSAATAVGVAITSIQFTSRKTRGQKSTTGEQTFGYRDSRIWLVGR
jgi:hypothetical protein